MLPDAAAWMLEKSDVRQQPRKQDVLFDRERFLQAAPRAASGRRGDATRPRNQCSYSTHDNLSKRDGCGIHVLPRIGGTRGGGDAADAGDVWGCVLATFQLTQTSTSVQ